MIANHLNHRCSVQCKGHIKVQAPNFHINNHFVVGGIYNEVKTFAVMYITRAP